MFDERDGECFKCHECTRGSAANPNKWPNFFEYPGGNGKRRRYCRGCVIKSLNLSTAPEQTDLRERLRERLKERLRITTGYVPSKVESILDAIMPLPREHQNITAANAAFDVIAPLLPQPAALDEARVRERAEKFTKQVCDYPSRQQEFDDDIARCMTWNEKEYRCLLELGHKPPHVFEHIAVSQAAPPASQDELRAAPFLLSRDEIVKRGDAKTCHWCRIGLPLEKSEETSSELITPIKWHPDKPHGHTCIGRGLAIYELVCEAVGAKP